MSVQLMDGHCHPRSHAASVHESMAVLIQNYFNVPQTGKFVRATVTGCHSSGAILLL